MQDIIFKKKEVNKTPLKQIDLSPTPTTNIFKTVELVPQEEKQKEAGFSPIDLAVPIIEKGVEKAVEIIGGGLRIHKLPYHEQDFATKWHYGTQIDKDENTIINEFNVYLQALEELEQGKIILPEGISGPTIAHDLKTYILRDFRTQNLVMDNKNNLAHRAFYAHCAKRAIDSIRHGEFVDQETGYTRKYPEIADALERRINDILYEKLINKND